MDSLACVCWEGAVILRIAVPYTGLVLSTR